MNTYYRIVGIGEQAENDRLQDIFKLIFFSYYKKFGTLIGYLTQVRHTGY